MVARGIFVSFCLLLSPLAIQALHSSDISTATTAPHNSTHFKDNSLSFRSSDSRPPLLVPSSQFPSLSSAFAAVQPGDVIELIASSPCDSNAVLRTANVTIMSSSHALFNCSSSSSSSRAFGVQVASTGGGGYVRIEGIIFVGGRNSSGVGGAISIEAAGIDVLISNCSFVNNYAFGGGGAVAIAMESDNSLCVIRGCIFEGNWCDGSELGGGLLVQIVNNGNRVVVEDSMFIGNSGGGGGGMAVNIGGETSFVHLTNNNFLSNNANSLNYGGGGVFIQCNLATYNSSVLVNGGSMTNNVAAGVGGGLFILYTDQSFSNSIVLSDTIYDNNSASNGNSGGGGGVLIAYTGASYNSSIVVNGGSMINNNAGGGGGGLYIYYNSGSNTNSIVLSGTIYSNNSANDATNGGGGVSIQYTGASFNSSVVVNGGSMTNNVAIGGGGAIYVFYTGQSHSNAVVFSAITFSNNSAPFYGGGAVLVEYEIASYNSFVILNGGYITSNLGYGERGGGLYVYYGGQSISNSIVLDGTNYRTNQGAVFIQYNLACYNSSIVVNGGSMTNNVVSGAGGGVSIVYFHLSHSNSVVLNGTIFSNNNAPTYGGAVYVFYVLMSYNSSIVINGGSMMSNIALGGGGALYVLYGGESTSNSVMLSGTIYANNVGAVSISYSGNAYNSSITVIGGSVTNNIAYGGGGGLYIYYIGTSSANTVVLSGTNYSNNANNNGNYGGGAVLIEYSAASYNSSVAVNGGSMTNNIASEGGGALYIFYGGESTSNSIVLSDTIYSNNNAPNVGGGGAFVQYGRASYNSSVVVNAGSMTANVAAVGRGGGLYVIFTGGAIGNTVSLQRAHFANNYANMGSAVMLQVMTGQSQILQVANCVFANNSATTSPQDAGPSNACLMCSANLQSSAFIPSPDCGFDISPQYCQQQNQINVVNYVQNAFVPYRMNSITTITNCSFIGNTVESQSGYGGGLSITNGQIIFNGNNVFIGNTAGMSGGAFALSGTSNVIINGNLTIAHGNTAATDTAISMSTAGSLTINGSIFIEVAAPIGHDDISTFDGLWLNNIGDVIFASNTSSSSSSVVVQCPMGYNVFNPSLFEMPLMVAGYPNTMIANNIRVSCTGCPYGEYGSSISSIEFSPRYPQGSSSSSSTGSTCLTCPGGAICSGIDNVRAKLGYWGQLIDDGDGQSQWRFTMCPSGYCCGDSNGCDPTTSSTTACAKGRNVSVALCGSCLDGYSQNIANSGCTLDEECDAGRWAWAVFILISLGWLGLLLVGGDNNQQQDVDSKSGRFDWFIPSFMFFYQNCGLIFEAIGSSPHSATVILSSIVNIFPSSSSSSSSSSSATDLCVMRGLSTQSKYGLMLLFPACVGGGLIILSLIARGWYWMRRAEDRPFLRRTQRAGAKLVVLFYTTVLTVTGFLLNCVGVNGDDDDTKVIMHAGGVVCYTAWQKGLMAVGVCLLIPLPFLMFGVQMYGRKKHQQQQSSWRSRDQSQSSISHLINEFLLTSSTAMKSALESTYRGDRWMWPCVVLIRRLLAVIVVSFGTDPAGQARWFCVLFLLYLLSHVIFHPFKSSVGNVIESMNLSILVIISLCEVQNGVLRDVGVGNESLDGMSSESPNMLDTVVTVLFLVPAVVSVIAVGGQWAWSRMQRRQRRQLGDVNRLDAPLLEKSGQSGVEMSCVVESDLTAAPLTASLEKKHREEIAALTAKMEKEREKQVAEERERKEKEQERLMKEIAEEKANRAQIETEVRSTREMIENLHRRLRQAGLDD